MNWKEWKEPTKVGSEDRRREKGMNTRIKRRYRKCSESESKKQARMEGWTEIRRMEGKKERTSAFWNLRMYRACNRTRGAIDVRLRVVIGRRGRAVLLMKSGTSVSLTSAWRIVERRAWCLWAVKVRCSHTLSWCHSDAMIRQIPICPGYELMLNLSTLPARLSVFTSRADIYIYIFSVVCCRRYCCYDSQSDALFCSLLRHYAHQAWQNRGFGNVGEDYIDYK